jgi:glucokinase
MTASWVGVDFGKTNVRFGAAGDNPSLMYYTKSPYSRGVPKDLSRQMMDGIQRALDETETARDGLRGIGIAVPAVVNRDTGSILWGPDWDFMAGASLTQPIADHFNVPVVADVDTVIPTWGEHWAGIGRTCDRFALLAWGTGLGAGLVIDGIVQEHPDHLFPEFGHSVVSDDDWPCMCGARGCLNTLVNGSGIARHGQLAVERASPTLLRDLCDGDPEQVTSPMVFDAADRGDAVAATILDRIAVLLGRLCANIVLTV